MNNAHRATILMATAQTLMELAQGLEVDTDEQEIVGALNLVGMDGAGLYHNNTLIRLIQIVCKEFGSIVLTDKDVTDMIAETVRADAEANTDTE